MRRTGIGILLALLAIMVMAGCRPVEEPEPVDVAGTNWILSSLGGKLPLAGTAITLQFDSDGQVAGSDGCNNYSTTYSTDGSEIRIEEPVAATMMACTDSIMEQATTYLDALTSATEFTVEDGQLTLRDGRTIVATFVEESQSLVDTSWKVTGYNNGLGGVVSVILGSQLTVDFSAEEITGNAGCNDYFASYTAEGENISIGRIGLTRMNCTTPAGIMEQETQFLDALETVSTYRVDGTRLELRDADGALAVSLASSLEVAVPTPEPGTPRGRVTGEAGVNIRSGPGVNYPVLGFAPYGTEGEIVGVSADGQWWAVAIQSAPDGLGWVSAGLVAATDTDNVPIIAAPSVVVPPPANTPAVTPTPVSPPTATPAPEVQFWVNQTTLDQGQCTDLNWSVENVQAVWVYPQGESYDRYPRTGQGSEQVCPSATVTYEMRVLLRDGTTTTQQVTIEVNVDNPLADTSWEVMTYNNAQEAVVTILDGTRLTANFDAAGQITGTSGCNDYAGPYQVSGDSISIGPLTSNMQACGDPAGIMEQESLFLTALQSVATYRIDGNRLDLYTASGSTAATLSR